MPALKPNNGNTNQNPCRKMACNTVMRADTVKVIIFTLVVYNMCHPENIYFMSQAMIPVPYKVSSDE
jgi:hypothetical protein